MDESLTRAGAAQSSERANDSRSSARMEQSRSRSVFGTNGAGDGQRLRPLSRFRCRPRRRSIVAAGPGGANAWTVSMSVFPRWRCVVCLPRSGCADAAGPVDLSGPRLDWYALRAPLRCGPSPAVVGAGVIWQAWRKSVQALGHSVIAYSGSSIAWTCENT